jgi:NAD-dependent deacetylase
MSCGKFYDADYIKNSEGIPKCSCGGTIKPDVVLYEEGLDDYVWGNSYKAVSRADVLIVGGTSLVVYPAAGLVGLYKGKKLVLINKSETQYDTHANLVIHESIGQVLDEAVADL